MILISTQLTTLEMLHFAKNYNTIKNPPYYYDTSYYEFQAIP